MSGTIGGGPSDPSRRKAILTMLGFTLGVPGVASVLTGCTGEKSEADKKTYHEQRRNSNRKYLEGKEKAHRYQVPKKIHLKEQEILDFRKSLNIPDDASLEILEQEKILLRDFSEHEFYVNLNGSRFHVSKQKSFESEPDYIISDNGYKGPSANKKDKDNKLKNFFNGYVSLNGEHYFPVSKEKITKDIRQKLHLDPKVKIDIPMRGFSAHFIDEDKKHFLVNINSIPTAIKIKSSELDNGDVFKHEYTYEGIGSINMLAGDKAIDLKTSFMDTIQNVQKYKKQAEKLLKANPNMQLLSTYPHMMLNDHGAVLITTNSLDEKNIFFARKPGDEFKWLGGKDLISVEKDNGQYKKVKVPANLKMFKELRHKDDSKKQSTLDFYMNGSMRFVKQGSNPNETIRFSADGRGTKLNGQDLLRIALDYEF